MLRLEKVEDQAFGLKYRAIVMFSHKVNIWVRYRAIIMFSHKVNIWVRYRAIVMFSHKVNAYIGNGNGPNI